jgi:hypothetical protein
LTLVRHGWMLRRRGPARRLGRYLTSYWKGDFMRCGRLGCHDQRRRHRSGDYAEAQQPIVGYVLTNAGLMANLSLDGTRIVRLDL